MRRTLLIMLAGALCLTSIPSCGKDEPIIEDQEKDPTEQPTNPPVDDKEDPNENPEEPGNNPDDPNENPETPKDEPEEEPEGSEYQYSVASLGIDASGNFKSGFVYENFWDEGVTLNYSVSELGSFLQLGNSMNVQIYVGSEKLLDGKEFDVTTTTEPFSFKIEYVDVKAGDTVALTIDNNNHSGATGTISLKKSRNGGYISTFDLTLSSGDVAIKGYYADRLLPRNTIYDTEKGTTTDIKSATLDISGNPCVLYLSTKEAPAGPDNFDIKGEVASDEWRFDRFMAFSGQGSSLVWNDGVKYDKTTAQSTPFFGGNWRVMGLREVEGGKQIAESTAMLFGSDFRYAYYYGEIKVITER